LLGVLIKFYNYGGPIENRWDNQPHNIFIFIFKFFYGVLKII